MWLPQFVLHLTVLSKYYSLDSLKSNVKQTPKENVDQLHSFCDIARNDVMAEGV